LTPTIDQYCHEQAVAGAFENQILYRMVRDHPNHSDPYVNAGKVVAIGEIYGASPKRGAGDAQDNAEDFFEFLGKTLCASDIDDRLSEIGFDQRYSDAIKGKVTCAHAKLVAFVSSTIRKWGSPSEKHPGRRWPRRQISFASKYLHFHRPNAFPILDQFAKIGLRCANPRIRIDCYADFCDAFSSYDKAADPDWTPRSIDIKLFARGRDHSGSNKGECRHCGR
jgi:hypothetical protein